MKVGESGNMTSHLTANLTDNMITFKITMNLSSASTTEDMTTESPAEQVDVNLSIRLFSSSVFLLLLEEQCDCSSV